MGVDMFWRRTPTRVLDGLTPLQRADLVPYWFDGRFKTESDTATVFAVEDHGEISAALIAALLELGTEAAWAINVLGRLPQNFDEDAMIGTLHPDDVQRVASIMAGASWAEWVGRHRGQLAETASALDYRRPLDDEFFAGLVGDAEGLGNLFGHAAAADEAVLVALYA